MREYPSVSNSRRTERPEMLGRRYPCFLLVCSSLLNSVDQQVQIVIEELEVVCNFLRSSHRWQHDQYFGASGTADCIRRLQIEIWLDEDQLHILFLHVVNEIERVLRCRRYSRFWFHVSDDIETESLRKVRERPMIRDHLHP